MSSPDVRAVIADEDRYLLAQHYDPDPANLGKWWLPGGSVAEEDPDHEEALHRVLREVLHAHVEIERSLNTYIYREHEHQVFLVRPRAMVFIPNLRVIAAAQWFSLEEVVLMHATGRLYADFVLEAIIASRDPGPDPLRRLRGRG